MAQSADLLPGWDEVAQRTPLQSRRGPRGALRSKRVERWARDPGSRSGARSNRELLLSGETSRGGGSPSLLGKHRLAPRRAGAPCRRVTGRPGLSCGQLRQQNSRTLDRTWKMVMHPGSNIICPASTGAAFRLTAIGTGSAKTRNNSSHLRFALPAFGPGLRLGRQQTQNRRSKRRPQPARKELEYTPSYTVGGLISAARRCRGAL